jgi:hypothetical protein
MEASNPAPPQKGTSHVEWRETRPAIPVRKAVLNHAKRCFIFMKRRPLPNGVRLSCAAKGCLSQMQFYYDGRRQLQPHVRRRHLELPPDPFTAESQPPTDNATNEYRGNEDDGVSVTVPGKHDPSESEEKSKAGAHKSSDGTSEEPIAESEVSVERHDAA